MTNKLESLSLELGKLLTARHWKCVTAESCTGGGLAYWITWIPGSSGWFERGFVAYGNLAKQQLLGVRAQTLNTYGSVSEMTAKEMAQGALDNSQSQLSVAITGIAGPRGETSDKPVGTVWIATGVKQDVTEATHYNFFGNRQSIRQQAIETAFKRLLTRLS